MGQFHPQVVHFAVALLVLGVLLRAVSLLGRPAFVAPAATLLLALGTIAIVVAAQTGQAAHGPVEQMPGVRPAVMEHEEWGERARNVFLVVLLVEGAALAFRLAAGHREDAIATLQQLLTAFSSPRIRQRLDELQGKTGNSNR